MGGADVGNPIANDFILDPHADTLRGEVNAAGLVMRLGVNNFTSDPADNLASFTECSATGYAEQSLTGQWGAVSNPTPGTWQFTCNTVTFTTTDVAPVSVYTWYITDGANVLWSRNFAAPAPFAAATPIAIQVTLRVKAEFTM